MAGRRPKPTEVKKRQGTLQKCRTNAKEPTPQKGAPKMPTGLSKKARAYWKDIAPQLDEMGVLTRADAMALTRLCEAVADWHQANEAEAEHGLVFTTVDGLIKANPATRLKSDADKRIRAWLIEFGLTPAARSKVSAKEGDEDKDNPYAQFLGKRLSDRSGVAGNA